MNTLQFKNILRNRRHALGAHACARVERLPGKDYGFLD
jgi:hypothetical protein